MLNMTEQLNATTNVVVGPPVPPATVTITQESLTAMIQAATQTAVEGLVAHAQASTVVAVPEPAVPDLVGLRQPTKPEECAAHRLLSVLDQGFSKVIVGTRDHVVVPMNLWVVDKAAPLALAVVAAGSVQVGTGAAKVTRFFTRVAEKAAAASLALTVQ